MSGNLIEKLIQGERPTLLEAEKGNELISAINALQNIQIEEGEEYSVEYGEGEVIITVPEQTATEQSASSLDGWDEVAMYVAVNGVPRKKVFLMKDLPSTY